MISTSALLWFAAQHAPYPPSVLEAAARYSQLWLFPHTDARGVRGPDYSSLDATVAQIRAVNPRARIGQYIGGVVFKDIDPAAAWLTVDDLLHCPDGYPLVFEDTHAAFSPPDDVFTYRMPNLLSDAVQWKLIDGYVRMVGSRGLDGILLDGYDPDFYAGLVRGTPAEYGMFGCASGCREGPMQTGAAWIEPLTRFGDRLRWRLEQVGARFVFNGIHPLPVDLATPTGAWNGVGYTNRLDHASGAMMEGIPVAYRDPAQFVGIIDTVQRAVAKRRSVELLVCPWGTPPDSLDVRRFYLGLYLLVQAPETRFGYSPYVPWRAWDGPDLTGHPSGAPAVFRSPDWDADYGYPLTPAMLDPGNVTVAWREYTRCYVVVNPLATTQQMGLSGRFRIWDGATLTPAAPGFTVNIPPKTAWVLWKI